MSKLAHHTRATPRRGLSLVEVVMSTLLVGLVLVGAMNLLGSVAQGRRTTADMARAHQLAHSLMAEILCLDYQEQGAGGLLDGLLNSLGIEAGESPSVRATFDDVDDYHGWTRLPPERRNGNPVPNADGWRRTVTVETLSGSNTGVKRITVLVSRARHPDTRLVALRSEKYAP